MCRGFARLVVISAPSINPLSALRQRVTPKGEAAAMNTQQMEQMGQFKITVWEEENFQGKRCEFMLECQNIMERGFCKIRSIKVENGP